MLNKFLNDKVKVTLENISSLVLQSEERIEKWQYKACDYKTDNTLPMPDDSWETFSYNDVVCGKDAHAWLYTEIKTPKVSENEEVYFDISTGY